MITISSILCLSILNSACQVIDKNKPTVKQKSQEIVYTSINDVLIHKGITVDSYKKFINNFLVKANKNFSEKEIEQKENYVYKEIGTNIPPQVKDNIHEMSIAKLSLQKIIDNSIDMNDMSLQEQANYNKTYHILYVNTQNTDLKNQTKEKKDLLHYFKKETNAKEHLKKIQNFNIFDGMVTKENSKSLNNSFDILQKMKPNEIKENVYINSSGNETYTMFKLISVSNNNQIIKERMIKLDLFKKQTSANSKADTLINILKYIDKSSDNLNIKDVDYNLLKTQLMEFDEEKLQDMIDYIMSLYINDYYKLNHIFND